MLEETIELSAPQYDFLTSRKKHSGFVAGFGSGKSYIGTLKTLLKIIDDRIPKTAYYLPTYGDIRDIAFDGFPTVADALGYEYKLNKTDKEFSLYDSGEKIGTTLFRNLSEPESIVGYQVGYTLIDETDIPKRHIMDKAFKKILGRNRLVVPVEDEDTLYQFVTTGITPEGTYWHNGVGALCWVNSIDVAGTPEGFKWFHDRFVTRFNPDTDILIRASTYSNLHNLPDDFIDTLREQYPSELFEAYVNGEFINLTSGTIYKYFKRTTHHSIEIDNTIEELYIGQDFNIGGCVSIVYVKRGDELIAVNEFESYDTKTIIDNIKHKYKDRVINIYPDASGNAKKTSASQTDINMLRNAGFKVFVNGRNPSVKDRHNIVNNQFEKMRLKVNTVLCPKFTNALEQHAFNQNGEPDKFAGAGTVDDYTDAGTYPIAYMFPIVIDRKEIKVESIPTYSPFAR
ncbi:MAG: terminase family protein [Bdellovibrionales bacterium]